MLIKKFAAEMAGNFTYPDIAGIFKYFCCVEPSVGMGVVNDPVSNAVRSIFTEENVFGFYNAFFKSRGNKKGLKCRARFEGIRYCSVSPCFGLIA